MTVRFHSGRVADLPADRALALVDGGVAEFIDPPDIEAYGMLVWMRATTYEDTLSRLAELADADSEATSPN